jgi:hypothetical protein
VQKTALSTLLRHNSCIAKEKPRKEIAALERELQRVKHEAERNQAALSALDEQRHEREGRLAVALRARQDLERILEEKRVEVARAEAEAALETLKQALADRDAAAEAFAAAGRSVMLRLQEFDAAQEKSESAWEGVVQVRHAEALELPDDPHDRPGVFTEALERLTELVGRRAERQFESDLVEAAARSPLGNDISTLPAHLQELARARHRAIARERRKRKHSNRGSPRTLFRFGHETSQHQAEPDEPETAPAEALAGETVAEESHRGQRAQAIPEVGADDQPTGQTEHDDAPGDDSA